MITRRPSVRPSGSPEEQRPDRGAPNRVSRSKLAAGAVGAALCLAWTAMIVPGAMRDAPAKEGRTGLEAGTSHGTADVVSRFPGAGSPAPDFALPRLHTAAPFLRADSLRLSDFQGRWVYLDVFGSWCPPCRSKYPDMIDIARRMDASGAAVIGLLLNDDVEVAASWLEDNGGIAYPFAVLDQETVRDWEITGAPMGFLISPEGRVAYRCYGCSRGEGDVARLPERIGDG